MLTYVIKRTLFIVLITVIAMAVAYFGFVRDTKTSYIANEKILFDQPLIVGGAGGGNTVQKLIQIIPTYAQVITSYSIAEKASQSLTNISPEEIQHSLSAAQVGESTAKTQILSVEANSSDAEKAIAIVSATVKALNDYVTNQQNDQKIKAEERLVLTVIEPATQAQIMAPSTKRTLMLVSITAIIVSAGGILVFDDFRRA